MLSVISSFFIIGFFYSNKRHLWMLLKKPHVRTIEMVEFKH